MDAPIDHAAADERGAILALGFGTTVAMWAAGYLLRLPFVNAPSWLAGVAMLLLMAAGGVAAGRFTARGTSRGAWAGLLAAVLNVLVLGSLVTQGDGIAPSAALWLPGFLVAGTALGALTGAAGAAWRGTRAASIDWNVAVAAVGAVATIALIAIGGLVTGNGAGLAVVDWPNSYGYNMFLFPLSRMTGGIYYEHAHRLFGALVGLTTAAVAIHLHRVGAPRGIRRAALAAVGLVIFQGILGGLRVTGRFTLSQSKADVAPSLTLAIVHGVTAQIFLALMAGIAVAVSRRLRDARPLPTPAAATDRALTAWLVGFIVVQLVLGAILRHTNTGLLYHLTMAAFVILAASMAGARAWWVHGAEPRLRALGIAMVTLISLQALLGIVALVAFTMRPGNTPTGPVEAVLTTAHQVTGAVLLALAAVLAVWTRRVLVPAPEPVASAG